MLARTKSKAPPGIASFGWGLSLSGENASSELTDRVFCRYQIACPTSRESAIVGHLLALRISLLPQAITNVLRNGLGGEIVAGGIQMHPIKIKRLRCGVEDMPQEGEFPATLR